MLISALVGRPLLGWLAPRLAPPERKEQLEHPLTQKLLGRLTWIWGLLFTGELAAQVVDGRKPIHRYRAGPGYGRFHWIDGGRVGPERVGGPFAQTVTFNSQNNQFRRDKVAIMKLNHVPGEVLVKTRPSLFKSDSSLAEDYGATVIDRFGDEDIFQSQTSEVLHLRLQEGMDTEAALKKMAEDPRVELVAPNTLYQLEGEAAPNDLSPSLWGLHNEGQDGGTPDADIDAPKAWPITKGSRDGGPIIAVLDTGQDLDHPDLKDNLWTNAGEIPGDGIDNDGNGVIDDVHGYDAVLDNGDPTAGHSHGTHCAGTIGATGDNAEGIVGVNWEAQVMPIKIFPDDGEATTAATILRAVEYADKMGARITSNSWTGAGYNPIVQQALGQSPALHIFAAGNEARDNDLTPSYPASFNLDNQIVVAASDRNDKLANFSCYGDESVDLAAPGVEILSTVVGGGYASWAGHLDGHAPRCWSGGASGHRLSGSEQSRDQRPHPLRNR